MYQKIKIELNFGRLISIQNITTFALGNGMDKVGTTSNRDVKQKEKKP